MTIRAFAGDLPAQCTICLQDEPEANSLIQTTCCTNVLGTEIIPKTYHRNCLREWGKMQAGDSFSCMHCKTPTYKFALFSKIERVRQYLFSPVMKEFLTKTLKVSVIAGVTAGITKIIDPIFTDESTYNPGFVRFAGLGMIVSAITRTLLLKPAPSKPSFLQTAMVSIPSALTSFSIYKGLTNYPTLVTGIIVGAITSFPSLRRI